MDVDKEILSSQKSSTKQQRIDSDFDPATSYSNASGKIEVSSSTHHVNSGNVYHGDRVDCVNSGDFGIGETDDKIVNYADVNDGDYGFK